MYGLRTFTMCLRSYVESLGLRMGQRTMRQTFAVPRAKNSRTTLLPSLVCTISASKSLQLFVISSVNEMDTRREHSPFKYSIVHFLSLPIIRNSSYLSKILPERPVNDGVTDRAFFRVVEPATERSVSEIERGNELTSSQDSPSAKRGYVFVVLHLSLAELQGGRHAHPL